MLQERGSAPQLVEALECSIPPNISYMEARYERMITSAPLRPLQQMPPISRAGYHQRAALAISRRAVAASHARAHVASVRTPRGAQSRSAQSWPAR